ncbi:MAG: DNA replication and repair protein RecF, partial [Clostridia bacterium]|nr:DNA replication and repair protein RecF [Clostridia bacterium]
MYLKKIKIHNFRNYDGLRELYFNSSGNVFIGKNAQGKTNLLEAIYYLALSQSFRTSKIRDLTNFEKDYFKLEGEVVSRGNVFILNHNYYNKNRKKETYINGVRCSNISQMVGRLRAVIFSPEHLSLAKGPPSLRRKYIDTLIAQVMPKYCYYFSRYRDVLSHRNALLKKRSAGDDLFVWDQQLCTLGALIIGIRLKALSKIAPMVENIFKKVSGLKGPLAVEYKSSLGKIDHNEGNEKIYDVFIEILKNKRDFEMMRGITSVGPHRDDIQIFLNEKP